MRSKIPHQKVVIIAIDGPAGAGKSTIARLIAQSIGFLYIDTGAMYRALTLLVIKEKIDIANEEQVIALAKKSKIQLENNDDGTIKVFLNGENVSQDIRKPEIAKFVSLVAKISRVRSQMVQLQREMGQKTSCVLDGRDIGTVVFPNADFKFFLEADFQKRVNRRYKELIQSGIKITPEAVAGDLKNRDTIDSTRECAPLKKADDAIAIDTTDLTIEQVVEKVLSQIH